MHVLYKLKVHTWNYIYLFLKKNLNIGKDDIKIKVFFFLDETIYFDHILFFLLSLYLILEIQKRKLVVFVHL